jgi:uncharacterized protein (DUF2141 family)
MLRKWIICLVGFMIVFVAVVALAQTEKVDAKGGGFTVSGHITIEKIKKTGVIYLELLTEEQYAIDDDDDDKQPKNSDSETLVAKNTAELKIAVGEQEIQQGKVAFVFTNIPAGTYAIDGFLDVNGNGEFDVGKFGPKEPWGSYRPARPMFRDARFDELQFEVKENLTNIEIEIK